MISQLLFFGAKANPDETETIPSPLLPCVAQPKQKEQVRDSYDQLELHDVAAP